MNEDTFTLVKSGPHWFEHFRGVGFPITALPSDLADYVRCQSVRFGIAPDFVAITALAQLGGTLAENPAVRSLTGREVPLLLRVIIATPENPGIPSALRESTAAMLGLQSELLRSATLDRVQIAEFLKAPVFRLPAHVIPTGDWDPRHAGEARREALRVIQHPLFILESPGPRELRHGFAGSYDRAVFAMYTGDILESLTISRRAGARRLGELLVHLCRGGQIDAPLKGPCRILQPRFGFLAATTPATLAQAVTSTLPDVREIVSRSLLLNLAGTSQDSPPGRHEVAAAGAYWNEIITSLLDLRRHHDGLAPSPFFHESLLTWNRRLGEIADQIPGHLHHHLPAFDDLPLQLAGLLHAIAPYGGARDGLAAEAGIEIAEWLLAQTLLTATDACEAVHEQTEADARERMLSKIVEFGPIDFWRLCRHYQTQEKAVHQPTLEALLEERRVRLNPEGKLEAA